MKVDITNFATAKIQPMLLSAMAPTETSLNIIIKPTEVSTKFGDRSVSTLVSSICIGIGTRDKYINLNNQSHNPYNHHTLMTYFYFSTCLKVLYSATDELKLKIRVRVKSYIMFFLKR